MAFGNAMHMHKRMNDAQDNVARDDKQIPAGDEVIPHRTPIRILRYEDARLYTHKHDASNSMFSVSFSAIHLIQTY